LSTTTQVVTSVNDNYSIGVTTADGCPWSASSNTAWLRVISSGNTIGSGTVVFNVEANTVSTFRTGTLTIAGQIVTVTQNGALNITTPAQLPDGIVGVPYSFTMQADGGNRQYTWSNPGGGLPPGLTLSSRGVLAGIPSDIGAHSFNIEVSDGLTSQTRPFSLNTGPQLTLSCTPASGPTTVGLAYTASCAVTGGRAPYSWSINPGTIPTGPTPKPARGTAPPHPQTTTSRAYTH